MECRLNIDLSGIDDTDERMYGLKSHVQEILIHIGQIQKIVKEIDSINLEVILNITKAEIQEY